MSGPKSSYNALTVDVRVRFSDKHGFCLMEGWLPDAADFPTALGVLGWVRGGGNIGNPWIFDREFDPEQTIDVDVGSFLAAGIAVFRIERVNGPHADVDSRLHPFYRYPDGWRLVARAIQFLKTHALDGEVTGDKAIKLPTEDKRYAIRGPSGGAAIAAMVALSPDGSLPYDSTIQQSTGFYSYTHSHRVGACILDDVCSDFGLFGSNVSPIYGSGISAAATPFMAEFRRIPASSDASAINPSRFSLLPLEEKRRISPITLVNLDFVENRHLGMFVTSYTSNYESSYFGSGMTFQHSGLATGTASGAVTITSATASAAIKLVSGFYVFAEPTIGNLADWTGTLTLRDGGGSAIGTITDYTAQGNDARKQYVTRQDAIDEAIETDGPIADVAEPHHCLFGALIQYRREQIRDRHGLRNLWKDKYYLGTAYPALISGDPGTFVTNGINRSAVEVAFLQNCGMV